MTFPARRADRGTATAEVAVALPALVAVVAIALWGISAAATRVACLDALHTAARAAARGEPLPQVRARALQAAPPGATLTVTRTTESAHLTLTAPFRPPSRLPLPTLTFRLTAETPTEPTAPALSGTRPLPPAHPGVRPLLPALPGAPPPEVSALPTPASPAPLTTAPRRTPEEAP
ncbi:TadE family type IV pilus minor pilin [Actinocorallia sp. B10E7]|uniref:TadE family type IV pilus minor pilin n=1 Tax=Actinocorallia sp. B10E7 TaxID=3153558 RepID=UPI00325F2B8D